MKCSRILRSVQGSSFKSYSPLERYDQYGVEGVNESSGASHRSAEDLFANLFSSGFFSGGFDDFFFDFSGTMIYSLPLYYSTYGNDGSTLFQVEQLCRGSISKETGENCSFLNRCFDVKSFLELQCLICLQVLEQVEEVAPPCEKRRTLQSVWRCPWRKFTMENQKKLP